MEDDRTIIIEDNASRNRKALEAKQKNQSDWDRRGLAITRKQNPKTRVDYNSFRPMGNLLPNSEVMAASWSIHKNNAEMKRLLAERDIVGLIRVFTELRANIDTLDKYCREKSVVLDRATSEELQICEQECREQECREQIKTLQPDDEKGIRMLVSIVECAKQIYRGRRVVKEI